MDAGVVDADLAPGLRCDELVRAWEQEQGFGGFTDAMTNTVGGRLRSQVHGQVGNALREGRCTTKPGSWLFGDLAGSLHPDEAGPSERAALRALIVADEHETRAELANRLDEIEGDGTEAELLEAVRPSCSPTLGAIIDAVVAYERFATLVDAAFRTLCSISHSMGSQPLAPQQVETHETLVRCARELPSHFHRAHAHITAIGSDVGIETRLGEFAVGRSPADLVQLLLEHHERVQAAKPPIGKRSWFDPLRNGWVVRKPYGSQQQPKPGFVHTVRIAALRRFLEDAAP